MSKDMATIQQKVRLTPEAHRFLAEEARSQYRSLARHMDFILEDYYRQRSKPTEVPSESQKKPLFKAIEEVLDNDDTFA